MARKPSFDLAAELAKAGFTPAQRDAGDLAALIVGGEEPTAARAATALVTLGAAGRAAVVARLEGPGPVTPVAAYGERAAPGTLDDGALARLVAALGLFARAGDAEARAAVLARTRDAVVRVRRAAIGVLGKLGGDDARAALLARWDAGDVTPDERRALAEALGKLGGDAAMARLRALEPGDDTELARRRDRAVLMADRSAQRDEVSTILVDVPPPAPVIVRLGCKAGLAPLLVDELAALGITGRLVIDRSVHRATGAALEAREVEIEHAGPLAQLFAARLWATIAIQLAPLEPGELATTLVRAITAPAVRGLLAAWTRGPIRWRLGFASGHKRAVVWRVARDVTAAAPELVNDPTATTWDILVDDAGASLAVVPRRLDDPRFAWRVAEVPAASHPSVAAALAWVATPRAEDRIWDPFCGSGAELVEAARRGGGRVLHGSDVDDAALAAAHANLAAAGLADRASLVRGDARTHAPGPIDLVITNPPLGSRVRLDAAALLGEALPNLVRQLAPGGRLVWITPALRRTTEICESLGLRRTCSLAVDLGGVRGHLERWEQPA